MKKLFIITVSLVALSCNKSTENPQELENLLHKISALEIQNKILQDSLKRNEEEFLFSQMLIGIPDEPIFKVGKKNNVVMLLHTYGRKLPKYEIYRIEGDKEIKVGENDGTKFNYEFIPKSIKDNRPEFLLKVPFDGQIIRIQAQLLLDVEN